MVFKLSNKKNQPSSLFNLISDCNWEDAATRIKYYPKESSQATKLRSSGNNSNKVLPLHHACSLNPSLELTETLLKSYPKAAQKKDSLFRRLPIHVACLYGASSVVVRELLIVYQDGAREKLSNGQIALHYACGSGASKEVIIELLKAYPEGARCQDSNGWLPIHLACMQNARSDVIQALLDAYPESTRIRTSRGNIPLNCINSTKNTGTDNKLEVAQLLTSYDLSISRRHWHNNNLVRRQSLSNFDNFAEESNTVMNPLIPLRKRLNTA